MTQSSFQNHDISARSTSIFSPLQPRCVFAVVAVADTRCRFIDTVSLESTSIIAASGTLHESNPDMIVCLVLVTPPSHATALQGFQLSKHFVDCTQPLLTTTTRPSFFLFSSLFGILAQHVDPICESGAAEADAGD